MSLTLAPLTGMLVLAGAHTPTGERFQTPTTPTWYKTKAYKGIFPDLPSDLASTPPESAITFSGGGSRAYTAAIGQLAGLNELGLLKNISYIGGVSGGNWAMWNFIYNANTNNTEALGSVLAPESLSDSSLEVMQPSCLRGVTDFSLAKIAAMVIRSLDQKRTIGQTWKDVVQQIYHTPLGITPDTYFTWSSKWEQDIKSRNSNLTDFKFQVPVTSRPFPVAGFSMVGPTIGSPFNAKTSNASFYECTPLGIGRYSHREMTFKSQFVVEEGGFLEPFAFGMGLPPAGLSPKVNTGLMEVPATGGNGHGLPDDRWSIGDCSAASSYAPGMFLSNFPQSIANDTAMRLNYWAASSTEPHLDEMLLSDGGSLQNINIISFILRGVRNIVAFANHVTPLRPASDWNPAAGYSQKDMDPTIGSFFGVLPTDLGPEDTRGMDLTRCQVFAPDGFLPLVRQLQAAQSANGTTNGSGVIASSVLTTVRNDFYGVPSGLEVKITWVYMSRLFAWESAISSELAKEVLPTKSSKLADPSKTRDFGHYKHFPHYGTTLASIDHQQANLLANMEGWKVQQNEALFRSALGY